MDTWLSYTLGYPSEVTANDVQVWHGETARFPYSANMARLRVLWTGQTTFR